MRFSGKMALVVALPALMGLAACGSAFEGEMVAACKKDGGPEALCECAAGVLADELSGDAQKVFVLKEIERKSWSDALKEIGFSDEESKSGERRDAIQDQIRNAKDRVAKECRKA